MKKLPLGIQNFEKLRNENCVYVDKTEHIYQLMKEGYAYFLSRPRRFGKSLLLSTIAEVFKGNRELFTGLWIYDKIDWKAHPIIFIDYSLIDYRQKGLYAAIDDTLDQIAQQFQLQLARTTIQEKLIELIEKLSVINNVVILVDEYDKPIVDYVDDLQQAEQNREILKNFYSGLKGMDAHIAFLFITGVSKFSKVSIFSDLNHLFDITLGADFATIAGYTQEELLTYFKNHLEALGANLNLDEELLIAEVSDWYDGYSWDGKATVFNPFSILNLFMKKEFNNYT